MKFRAVFFLTIVIFAASAAFISQAAGTPRVAASPSDDRNDKSRHQAERTLSAEPNVILKICTVSGAIRIHGWDKTEIRVRSNDAAAVEFRRLDGTPESTAAHKVEVRLADKPDGLKRPDPCQSQSDVDVDVPKGATVSAETRDANITLGELSAAYANTQSGDIEIEGVARFVEAGAIGGMITLRNSSGRVYLHTVGGAIEARKVRPSDSADRFDISTVGGDVNLEDIGHAQVNAHTVNGDISMAGALARGGRYEFHTFSGDVMLSMPADSSFRLNARMGQSADIITDFPLTLKPLPDEPGPTPAPRPAPPQNPSTGTPAPRPEATMPPSSAEAPTAEAPKKAPKPEKIIIEGIPGQKIEVQTQGLRMRRIYAVCGTGDALIVLASFSGTVHLRKQ